MRKTRDLLAVLVVGLLHLVLYRKVIRLWWMYDDVNNLRSVMQFPFYSSGLALRIRYESPEGWTTYSPELALDFVGQPRVNWSRR